MIPPVVKHSVKGKEKKGAVTSQLMKAACGYPAVLLINMTAILLMRSLLIVKEQVEVILLRLKINI